MSSKNLTEAKTREQYIDPMLVERGWNVNDKNQVEKEYLIDWAKDKEGKTVNDRFVDYLLSVSYTHLTLPTILLV